MVEDERPLAHPDARPIERPAWLTYAQAGERLGLSPEAVRHRARRSGWRSMPGNDGRTLVLVPDDIDPVRMPARTAVQTPDQDAVNTRAHGRAEQAERAFETALAAIETAHANEVAALRERADVSEQARLAAQALADTALAQLTNAGARADAEITALREMVGGLRDTVARAETRAAHAEQRATEADAKISQAEADATALRDRLTGMREQLADAHAALQAAAEAGARTERAERDKERAEQTRDAERARAEALRATIDELKAGRETHASELAVVQHDAQTARQAAAELRLADDARKARGRLRRAWDGWRGR